MKRSILVSLAFGLVLTACGLKVPVSVGNNFGGINNGDQLPEGAIVDPGTGEVIDPGTGEVIDPGSGVTDPGDGVTDPGDGVTDPGEVGSGLFANETEGIRNDQITLCTHVPVTGAAPLARNPDRFGQFYFNYVNEELGGIHGRKVRFIAYDDAYNPTGARAAFEKCRREGAFIYFGAAGTDQIVSVAKLAEQYGLPYFHGPTSDKDMLGFKYNIHAAPTYEDQHRLLARYLVDRYGKTAKYGMVRVASVFFGAGHDAFVDELRKLGVDCGGGNPLCVDREVQKDERSFSDVITELQTKGVTVVNNFTTPSIWINMIPQAGAYRPTWTAVSPIAGFNLVANAIPANTKAVVFQHFNPGCNCTNFENGRDESLPYAADITRFVQLFKQYSPETSNPPIDDFDYGAYISAKGIHRILLALGPQPTRSKFFTFLQTYKEKAADTYPGCPAQARGERRLGHSVNVIELQGGKWKQLQGCVDVSS